MITGDGSYKTTYNTAGTLSLSTSSIYLKGTFNSWSQTDAFCKTADDDVVTVTKTLDPGTYEFKLHNIGTDKWYGKDNTTVTDEVNRLAVSASGGNMNLTVTGGSYEFRYEISTNRLSVFRADSSAIDQMPTVATEPTVSYILGDVNGNGEVDILDATGIQRVLVHLVEDTDGSLALRGDVNHNGLDILDATVIQRYIAKLPSTDGIGETVT